MPVLLTRLRQRALTAAIVCSRALVSQLAFGVSAIVENGEGRVLLVRGRFESSWGLPGGGVAGGEPPERAILRELAEEVGLSGGDAPQLIGLYTRRIFWATNVIALYRVTGGKIAFRPNLEIREIQWADPKAPPHLMQAGAARRLAEFTGRMPRRAYW